MLEAIAKHKIGKAMTDINTSKDRITLRDFVQVKFESSSIPQLVSHTKIVAARKDFRNIDEVLAAALLLGSLYGEIMGSSYGNIFRNAATEMVKFYLNMDAREEGDTRAFSVQRMADIYDHLLFKYCDQVNCTAKALAARMRIGSENMFGARCRKVKPYLKIPNVMDMSRPNGYFRAEFKKTIKRRISSIKRSEDWTKALSLEFESAPRNIRGNKDLPWKTGINLERWIHFTEIFATSGGSVAQREAIDAGESEFADYIPRIQNDHPYCPRAKQYLCLKFNSHDGCNTKDCTFQHEFFDLSRKSRDIQLVMTLLGGHKDSKKLELQSDIFEAYIALKEEHFSDQNEKKQAPKGGISLDKYASLQCDGKLTDERKIEVALRAPGSAFFKANRDLRPSHHFWNPKCSDQSWDVQKSLLLQYTKDAWCKAVNEWKRKPHAEEDERKNVNSDWLALAIHSNISETLTNYEASEWLQENNSPDRIIEFFWYNQTKASNDAMSFKTPWPEGKPEERIFGNEPAQSHDLGERISGNVGGNVIINEENSCYPLAVVAAILGVNVSRSKIEREAFHIVMEQRRMAKKEK